MQRGLETILHSSCLFQIHIFKTPFQDLKTPNRICCQIFWGFQLKSSYKHAIPKTGSCFIIYYWFLKPSKLHFNRLSTLSHGL